MRKLFPLLGIGCGAIIVIGLIVGGVILVLEGLDKSSTEPEPVKKEQPKKPRVEVPPPPVARKLVDERRGFKTRLVAAKKAEPVKQNLPLPPENATVIKIGGNAAFQSNQPPGRIRRPAIVWAHAGFAGISPAEWEKTKPLRDVGFLIFMPSFRGEMGNGGQFEMFFGEVDDLVAAIDHAASYDFVDKNRIYVVGHEEGGTLAMLAAETGNEKARAFIAISGPLDLTVQGNRLGETQFPFFVLDAREKQLRSPERYVAGIRRPTFYINSKKDRGDGVDASYLMHTAQQFGAPFTAKLLDDAKLESVLVMLAPKLRDDTGPLPNIQLD